METVQSGINQFGNRYIEVTQVQSKRRGRGCNLYAGLGCGCLTIFLITILTLIGILIYTQYTSWESNFQLESDPNYLISADQIEMSEREEISKKLEQFAQSNRDSDFVQLSPREVGILLIDNLNRSESGSYRLEQVYVEPFSGEWYLHMKGKWHGVDTPWIVVHLHKDNVESAQLEIPSVRVGNIRLESIGFKRLVEEINSGYREALQLVNSGAITSRSFQNIELQKDLMIIKGNKKSELSET